MSKSQKVKKSKSQKKITTLINRVKVLRRISRKNCGGYVGGGDDDNKDPSKIAEAAKEETEEALNEILNKTEKEAKAANAERAANYTYLLERIHKHKDSIYEYTKANCNTTLSKVFTRKPTQIKEMDVEVFINYVRDEITRNVNTKHTFRADYHKNKCLSKLKEVKTIDQLYESMKEFCKYADETGGNESFLNTFNS